jgi:hypothetical protein
MGGMKRKLATVALAAALAAVTQPASAHCDTLDGPVVSTARAALQSGDVTPVLKWVPVGAEPEIRTAFARTLKVRTSGAEARDLADMYFYETVVRLHRAGEGQPYTGLKPAGAVEPVIALADKAIASGDTAALIRRVMDDAGAGLRERLAHAAEARRHAGESVEAGRRYVAAYVGLMHYLEQLSKEKH